MATDTVNDYLGHPSELAEAFKRYAESVTEARKIAAEEPREIARQVGIVINEINDRVSHGHEAMSAIRENLQNDIGEPGTALLVMAEEYQRRTCDEVWRFAGIVLVALEQAGLVRKEEVAHG